MSLEKLIRNSKLFSRSEQRALLERLNGSRNDPHGTFAGRVKPKLLELLEWSKPEHKRRLKRALAPKKKNNTRWTRMGHNIDLGMFGMNAIRCKSCGKDLDLSEVDIDCDLKTYHPMQFELSLDCFGCGKKNEFQFRIVESRGDWFCRTFIFTRLKNTLRRWGSRGRLARNGRPMMFGLLVWITMRGGARTVTRSLSGLSIFSVMSSSALNARGGSRRTRSQKALTLWLANLKKQNDERKQIFPEFFGLRRHNTYSS